MRKLSLIFMAMAASFALQAQWTDDSYNNNHLANSPDYVGEIYVATDTENGDTYVQWSSLSNGWSPSLQRLTFDGTPQWGEDGIRITGHDFASWSQGNGMAVTADHAVVSCFATLQGITAAVKINADGTYAWGEQGVTLFDGHGNSRAEIIAGDDGGAWALGFEGNNLYLQYIKSGGSLFPCITISKPGYRCAYGQLTLGPDNTVFLTYETLIMTGGVYSDKEIHLVGYAIDGTQISPDVLLMSTRNMVTPYIHYVVPDGLGGAYAYIWHNGIGDAFNTFVFHYDANGNSTISDTDGIPVHSLDPVYYRTTAKATVDPITHDLLITYMQTDAWSQSEQKIYMNRITATGERLWDEGILVFDNGTNNCGSPYIDAFEDGSGFSVAFYKSNSMSDDGRATIEAIGYDMNCDVLWNKQICSNFYPKTGGRNSAGFHMGQNILVWENSNEGGIIGQNFTPDGTLGVVDPIIPVTCPAPENLEGEYAYDMETDAFGVRLTWTAPEIQPLHYNLYRNDFGAKTIDVIEIDGSATDYYDETGMGDYMYQLTAVFENCESDFALTPDGQDFVYVEVTGIPEDTDEEIVTLVRVINTKGQTLPCKDVNELNSGLYILQGMTKDGKMVSKKILVNR